MKQTNIPFSPSFYIPLCTSSPTCSPGNPDPRVIIDLSGDSFSFSIPTNFATKKYNRNMLEGIIKDTNGNVSSRIYRRTITCPDFTSYEEVTIRNEI